MDRHFLQIVTIARAMIRRVHLNNRFLQLSGESERQLAALRAPRGKENGYPCFLRVEKQEVSETDGMRVLYFSKQDITYIEMVNTLAYLETKEDCKDILWMAVRVGRPSWRVFETNDHVVVHITPDDLRVVQYGWACKIACYKRTHRYVRAPVYPWVARAWMDANSAIFKHGVACLVSMIWYQRNIMLQLGSAEIAIIRTLPAVLAKFGQKDGRYVWETALLDHYMSVDNPFLLSLASFLIPPHNNDFMYITQEGVQMFKDPWAPELLREFYNSRQRHVCKDGKTYKLTLRGCPSLYPTLYTYILSPQLSPSRAFALFKSVRKKRMVRTSTLGKRNRTGTPVITGTRTDDIERIYASAYRQLLDRSFDKETEICHLARLLLYVEIRKDYGSSSFNRLTPLQFCSTYSVDAHWQYVQTILCKKVAFDPAVQLPKKTPHAKDITASEAFPVLMLNEETKSALMDACGKNMYTYFR